MKKIVYFVAVLFSALMIEAVVLTRVQGDMIAGLREITWRLDRIISLLENR